MKRRDFLKQGFAATAASMTALPASARARERHPWRAGSVAHLLPTVSHDRILLKVSLQKPVREMPSLRLGSRAIAASPSDTLGFCWSFDVPGLEPATSYDLALQDGSGRELCDPWSLRTFPSPDQPVRQMRLLIFTCAGGHDGFRDEESRPFFLPMTQRARLLQRGLSLAPDAVIAIGDHVYWDLLAGRTAQMLGQSERARQLAGVFERSEPVLGTKNERVLRRAVGPQITGLYGTACRSVPVFFVQDDHDYFENDHADQRIVTFPPDDFMLRLGRVSQRLYYPEYLPDPNRPSGLAGSSAPDRPAGVSESFGTLRYGRLAELLLYDCRRFMTLKGTSATFLPQPVEAWMMQRMAARDTDHLIHVPSTPVAWSAGKWAEWYPDVLDEDGKLGIASSKYLWQSGWNAQHDRLLAAASGRKERLALFISGDLHCLAEGKILRSGKHDFRSNPVISAVTGPMGPTGPHGWPSAFRGTPPLPPQGLDVEEALSPLEENGFTVLDLTPESATFRFFQYNRNQPAETIDTLEPFYTIEHQRGARA